MVEAKLLGELARPLRADPTLPASLRIAVDLSALLPGGANGGVKPFALEYVRELSAIEGPNITWVFLTSACSHDEVRELARPRDELVCIHSADHAPLSRGTWRDGELMAFPPPLDLLLKLEISVLYSPLGSTAHACPGIPFIVTIVDVLHRDYPTTLTPQNVQLREHNFQTMLRAASRFQCISDYTASRMTKLFGVKPKRLFRTHIVIHHRLDGAEAASGSRHPRPYFFYPANAWAHKNHLTLLVAYRLYRIQAGKNAWDLVLTGHDDEAMRDVLTSAQALGLAGSVYFHGHLPTTEFAALWLSAGALIFPSLHEGFGIPLLEAMHFGLPILCSRAGSLPEVAGEAALYVDAREPMSLAAGLTRMAGDPLLRTGLIAAGRQQLARFSLRAEAQNFLTAIFGSLDRDDRPLWVKGLHADGWIEDQAIIALPKWPAACAIEIKLGPNPVSRRVRAYLGRIPLGGFDVAAGTLETVRIPPTHLDGSPLVLEVVEAGNLNPQDHRRHGVIFTGIELVDGEQVHHPLNHVHA